MNSRISALVVFVTASLLVPSGQAADLAREYEQVKAIAQRDPKVRAAYAAADQKLADKIIEIDPALKGYTPGRSANPPASKPAAKPAPKSKPAPASAKSANYQRSHVVAKGETLGGIAAKYHVTTDELRAINEIKDPKKLVVGQVLALPNSSAKPAPKAKKESSWWENLKNGL